jgi:hypothetical protein
MRREVIGREVSMSPAASALGVLGARVLYGASIATTCALSTLLVVVLCGPLVGPGEEFEVLGLWWLMSLPLFLIGGAVSTMAYRHYRSKTTWGGVAAVFLGNVLLVVLLTLFLMLGWALLTALW